MSGRMLRLPGETGTPVSPNIVRVGFLLVLAFGVLAAGAGYWQVMQARDLSTSPDNPAVIAAHRNIERGIFYDRTGKPLVRDAKDANGEPYRVYADPAMSPLLGYASRYYGSGGLEHALDAQLTGMSSGDPALDVLRKFEANPYDPSDVTLTISQPLQQEAVAALGANTGAVVMLDPASGQILAMASTPVYDASAIASPDKKTADAAWTKAQAPSANQPLLDRPVQGLYTPGSAFKIVTAIAGLGSGAITPATMFPDQPADETKGFVVDGFKVTDGHHPWTGSQALDFYNAVEESCNIYFAHTGLAAGGAGLRNYADQLGFDAQIPIGGVELPTAVSQVNKGKGTFGGGFADAVDLANAAYGQSAVAVTPLQMALVASTVANGGLEMTPQLVLSTKNKSGIHPVPAQRFHDVIAPDQASQIARAMQQAVEGQYGQRFTTGAKVPGVPTAGKSGTAQLGGTGEPHSWFIGFAPVDNPKIAIAVIVEHGGSGALAASPIAGRLMTYYLKTILASSIDAPLARAQTLPELVADRRERIPEVAARG